MGLVGKMQKKILARERDKRRWQTSDDGEEIRRRAGGVVKRKTSVEKGRGGV
jgi:hypothetical protein